MQQLFYGYTDKECMDREVFQMGLAIIFAIVTLFCVWGVFRSLREKNFMGLAFAGLTVLVFGAFTVATMIDILFGSGGGGGH